MDFDRDSDSSDISSISGDKVGPSVAELPVTVSSCIVLNQACQKALTEFREFLVSRLEESQARHEYLKSKILIKEEGAIPNTLPGHSHPNALSVYYAPFFKDIKGFTAPLNKDAVTKKNNNELNQAYIKPAVAWNSLEKARLIDLVREAALKEKCKPIQLRKQRLVEELNELEKCREQEDELPNQGDDVKADEKYEAMYAVKYATLAELEIEIELIAQTFVLPGRTDSASIDWMRIAVELDSDHDWRACQLAWINEFHRDINKTDWTTTEDTQLKSLYQIMGNDWERISNALGTQRLPWQCAARYQSEFNPVTKRTGPLSKAEALLVERVVSQCRIGDYIPWHQVNYFIEGRTQGQIKHYWNKVSCLKHNEDWTELEDKVLAAAVQKYGTSSWKTVSHYVYGRNNRQCRERYILRLGINNRKIGDWSDEEDRRVITLAHECNFKWVNVEKQMEGRNSRQIASRYDLLMKWHELNKKTSESGAFNQTEAKAQHFTRKFTVKKGDIENRMAVVNSIFQHIEDPRELDQFLTNSRQMLEEEYASRKPPVVHFNRGRKKKSLDDEDVDAEITQMFTFYNLHQKDSANKGFARAAQDQAVFEATELAMKDLLDGKQITKANALQETIGALFENHITSLGDGQDNKLPAVFPPNRITLRAFQGLLLQRDYLAKRLFDASLNLSEPSLRNIEESEEFRKLLLRFVGLFFWPAIFSLEEAPLKPELDGEKKHYTKHDLKSARAANASRIAKIRDSQKMLIETFVGGKESGDRLKQVLGRVKENGQFRPEESKWFVRRNPAIAAATASSSSSNRTVPNDAVEEILEKVKSKKTITTAKKIVSEEKVMPKKKVAKTATPVIETPRQSTRLAGKRKIAEY